MKTKITNIFLTIAIIIIIYVAIATNDKKDTIDALSGATPTNEIIDAISGASRDGDDD